MTEHEITAAICELQRAAQLPFEQGGLRTRQRKYATPERLRACILAAEDKSGSVVVRGGAFVTPREVACDEAAVEALMADPDSRSQELDLDPPQLDDAAESELTYPVSANVRSVIQWAAKRRTARHLPHQG